MKPIGEFKIDMFVFGQNVCLVSGHTGGTRMDPTGMQWLPILGTPLRVTNMAPPRLVSL